MSEIEADATIVKRYGWRQGSVVPQAIVKELMAKNQLPKNFRTGDILMVISHDCDVTREDYGSEPNVELLIVRVIDEPDGNHFWFNSPRNFQIEDKASGMPVTYAMSVHDRFQIPRQFLALCEADKTRMFEKETLQRIAMWVSRRYSRPAFPDSFNNRTNGARRSLHKEFKKNGEHINGIYLLVSDEELPAGQDYVIVIRATMTVEHYADGQRQKRAMDLLNKLVAALDECDGIDVQESHLVSEAEVSLDDLRLLKRWDFDSISLRNESVTSLPQIS